MIVIATRGGGRGAVGAERHVELIAGEREARARRVAVGNTGRNAGEIGSVQPRLADMVVIAARGAGGDAVCAEAHAELIAGEKEARTRSVAIGNTGWNPGEIGPVQPRLSDVIVIAARGGGRRAIAAVGHVE